MKVGILGTGSWGTALAQVLVDNGNDVLLWGIDEKEVEDINVNHHNSKFYPNPLAEGIKATLEIKELGNRDAYVLAVPSVVLETTIEKLLPYLDKKTIFINVAKGFHPVTHERLSVVLNRCIQKEYNAGVVSLIGPSHAEEVIERKITVVNAVCEYEEVSKKVQEAFSNNYFRVYRNTDVIGAEIGVAIKNVMAIASGILEGIGQGDNARAALITRGLAEMTRFGIMMGGKKETYLGLDGVGDLIVTCSSKHSRNFNAGYQIGKDGGAKHFMETNTKTVEGISACKVVNEIAKEKGMEMPIVQDVYAVLFVNKKPEVALEDLMSRELKSESMKEYNKE